MIGRAPLIGRESELGELGELSAKAAAGTGRLVLLAGEAGVGKTRLAEAAIAEAPLAPLRGAATVRGAAPYGPIVAGLRDALRGDAGALGRSGPLSAHLGTLMPELGAPPVPCDRATLVEAIVQAFGAISADKPTVVFLDDLHWADAATLELLPVLAAAAEAQPLLVVAAYRSDELPRDHPLRRLRVELRRAGRLTELVVSPLDHVATIAMVACLLDEEPGPGLQAAVYDRTQGVPFLVEELTEGLAVGNRLLRSGETVDLDAEAEVPIPQTIRDTVRFRCETLSESARVCLEAAAAIGVRVPLELLSALGGDESIEELLARGLLSEVEDGVARFRHDLIREALYADTPWPRRRALHRRLAELLEAQQAEPRLVADHWLAAKDAERARPMLLEAARRFCALHAYRDAAAAGRAALELWPEGEDEPERLAALDELGRCAHLCGELTEAARAWEEAAAAVDHADDRHWAGALLRQLATVYQLQGNTERSTRAHRQAAELFTTGDLPGDAASERLAAAGSLFPDDVPAALSEVDRALSDAQRGGRNDLAARALSMRGFFRGLDGHHSAALEDARGALTIAGEAGEIDLIVDAYWTLGTIANFWADYEQAESAFAAAADLCREHGRRPEEATCVTCLGLVLFNRGDWTTASELARQVQSSDDAPKHATGHAVWILGIISASRGATKHGKRLLQRALTISRELPMPVMEVQSLLGLGLADELEGNASQRWPELLDAPPAVLSLTYASGLRWASTFAARRGDQRLVRSCADRLADWAGRFASTDALAGLAHALGEVTLLEGAAERAAEQFSRALELLRDIDAPFELAHSQLRAAVALAHIDEREAAVDHLVQAYHTLRRLQARPFARQAAAELERLGERVERRLGQKAARDLEHGGLSRRELEVLQLVAVGHTNRDIADALFLSHRTVEMHVRNILTKLACRSRTEATAKAHQLGLLAGGTTPQP